MRKKVLAVLPCSAIAAASMAIPAFAADTAVDISAMLDAGFTTVQSDMLGSIASATPKALVVIGAVMAIKFGVKFFKGLVG